MGRCSYCDAEGRINTAGACPACVAEGRAPQAGQAPEPGKTALEARLCIYDDTPIQRATGNAEIGEAIDHPRAADGCRCGAAAYRAMSTRTRFGFGGFRPSGERRRQAILEILRRQPGLGFRDILRATGIPSGAARHHIAVLKRRRDLWLVRQGNRLLHFAGLEPSLEETRLQARRQSLDALDAALVDFVEAQARIAQIAVLDAFRPRSRSTIWNRLNRLVRHGFLQQAHIGRRVVYRVAWATQTWLAPIVTKAPEAVGVV